MDTIKITFIGDIMCEKPFLQAAQIDTHQYDFMRAFSGLNRFFQRSDYVIGNLETVCAGEEKRYSHQLYSFNTPDSFIHALKKCGVDFVSTANNHCLDRGVEGLKRTLDILDINGIGHTGTYRTLQDSIDPCIVDIDGFKLGLIAFTYGTNSDVNYVLLDEEEQYCVNLLQPQNFKENISIFDKLKGLVSIETKTKIKKILGKQYKNTADDHMPKNFNKSYLNKLMESIKKVKETADYTVCLLHCGGQFNREPGEYSKYMMNLLVRQGVESVIGNHAHNVQKSILKTDGIITYCLGNVSISPSSIYVSRENLPEYSIAVHMYFSRDKKKLERITVSVLKIEEDDGHYLNIYPIHELYRYLNKNERSKFELETKRILQTFMQKEFTSFKIQEEYDFLL